MRDSNLSEQIYCCIHWGKKKKKLLQAAIWVMNPFGLEKRGLGAHVTEQLWV